MATFSNMATLSYNGNVTNSNIVTGQLREVLSATKTAVVDTYASEQNVTYVVSIVNSGTMEFTGLTVTDNLGEYDFGTTTLVPLDYVTDSVKYFINGILQPAPTIDEGPPLVFSGINVPAGGNTTLVYESSINQYGPLGTTDSITNKVTVSEGGLSTDVIATEIINTLEEPNLTIIKSLSPTTVTENGQLTYTFTIQNKGNTAAVAADGIILTDTFDPILNPISVTFNGTPWASPTNYTYDTTTGVFSTIAGQITVPTATYTQDTSGVWNIVPGLSTLVVTGTV